MVLDNLVREACQHPHYRVGLKKLSASWNSEVSALGVFLSIVLIELQLGQCQVATGIGRHPFKGGSPMPYFNTTVNRIVGYTIVTH